jgi:hypothetical protein
MGWTKTQVAELKNGSILLTSRLGYACVGTHSSSPHASLTTMLRRGFARCDDGGQTWAQTWLLEDRQPEVRFAGTCEHTLVSDPVSGLVYYSLPAAANYTVSNYTVFKSLDGGSHWDLTKVVNPAGSDYSDS